MSRKVVTFGVPSAAGAFTDAPAKTPAALRAAGLLAALGARGIDVTDGGDERLFPPVEDPEHPTCRNVPGVIDAMSATAAAAASTEGVALMIGGDCSLLPGLLAGTRRRVGDNVGLVFLDAHGDLNTPQTTPSGRICGMALAVALGHGEKDLVDVAGTPPLDPGRTVMLGFRELDPGERRLIEGVGLAQEAASVLRNGMDLTADLALRVIGATPFVLHFDVDVIDAKEMSTQAPAALGRGLSRASAAVLLRRLLRSPQAVAVGVTGFDAERDTDGHHARALVEILAGAFGPES